MEGWGDGCEEGGKGGGVVAGESPECAAGGDVASYAGDESWEESDDEESNGSSISSRSLAVNRGQGENGCGFENGIEILDGVEEGDEVEEGGCESNDKLEEHCLGDVARRTVNVSVKLSNRVETWKLTLGSPQQDETRNPVYQLRKHH